jgi:hypothetical protein
MADFGLWIRAWWASAKETVASIGAQARVEAWRVQKRGALRPKVYLQFLCAIPLIWWKFFRVRTARRVRLRHHDNGFFANVLAVLDVLGRVRSDCRVYVDWQLTGSERHFRYGMPGLNLWEELFEPLCERNIFESAPGRVCEVNTKLDPRLIGQGRDLLSSSSSFPAMRRFYHRIYHERFRIRNTYVIQELQECQSRMKGRRCLGVHKRLGHGAVAANQRSGWIPSAEDVRRSVDEIASRFGETPLVYLATDELDCIPILRQHLGCDLLCRPGVQRVRILDRVEVHRQDWGLVGVKDACDVLVDGLLLSRCEEFLHISSNVSTCVAFLNPDIRLTPLQPARRV